MTGLRRAGPGPGPAGVVAVIDGGERTGVRHERRADPLALADVLGALDPDDRRSLAARATRRRLAAGALVYSQGQRSESLLMVESGRLKVSHYSADGSELIFAEVLPGEIVGELGVLTGAPRSATVIALTDCEVLALRAAVLVELLEARPALALALLRLLAGKVQQLTDLAGDLVFLDLSRRLAKLLLVRDGPDGVPLTQGQLAAHIGASRQRVNTCLAEFRRRGWIAGGGRRLRVTDAGALRRHVGG